MSDDKKEESYRDILKDCLQSMPKGGDLASLPETIEETEPQQERSHSKHLILFSSLSVLFLLFNIAFLAFYSPDNGKSLSSKEADVLLQVKYGEDYKDLSAIHTFLGSQESSLNIKTRSFRESVDSLNESLSCEDELEEQGEFSHQNFLFVGKTLIYRE
ncbi:MAG: hypothetical protein KDD55_13975 [Bdellovibrionales bacterium]|nr:hypothetical protein [Bdellovibrionales bacterium]